MIINESSQTFFEDFSMKPLINKAVLKLNVDGTKQILEVP